jgi:hypothetical protein
MVKAVQIHSSMVAAYENKNGGEVTLRRPVPGQDTQLSQLSQLQGIARPSDGDLPTQHPADQGGDENHRNQMPESNQPRQLFGHTNNKPPPHPSHARRLPYPPPSYHRRAADAPLPGHSHGLRENGRYRTRDSDYVTHAGLSYPAEHVRRAAYAAAQQHQQQPRAYMPPEAYQRARRHYRSTFYRSSVEGDHRMAAGGIAHAMGPAPRLVLSQPAESSSHTNAGRALPLQTVAPNQQVMDRPSIIPPVAVHLPQEPPSATKQPPEKRGLPMKLLKSPVTQCFAKMLGAGTYMSMNYDAVTTDMDNLDSPKHIPSLPGSFVRSCAAASYLANHPTPDMVKKQLARKEAATSGSSSGAYEHMLEHSDVRKTLLKRKSGDADDWTVENQETALHESTTESPPFPKRLRGLKSMTLSEEEASAMQGLSSNNPFVQLMKDEDLYHQVILQMTLETEAKDVKKGGDEPVSTTIGEGFYWRDYPTLEAILHAHMKAYYEMSSSNRQSRYQQNFNNQLVIAIRTAAQEGGYTFDSAMYDKRLRDRMRCFYKTHLQNSKKRLVTLQKHPTSALHQSQLRMWMARAGAREEPPTSASRSRQF